MSLWQEIADNFYPEREGFITTRVLGEDFAAHLMTSFPVLVRRDLGDLLSSMLRPSGKEWFHMRAEREESEDNAAKRWLEYATGVQRRAMYDISTQFVRSTKEADHDFATFGQCVLTVELNREGNGLLYRSWHLKDVAWCDGFDGKPDIIHKKWTPLVRTLEKLFPGKLHQDALKRLKDDPYSEIPCRRIVIPSDEYDSPVGKKWRTPLVSVYLDVENEHVIEEQGIFTNPFVIPRWKTGSGSQYAYSPAVMAALPEARLMQAMALTLLEAGEKAVNPPLVAKRELFRDDFNYFAGGLSYADLDGDQNIRDALEILTNDKSGIPFGIEMREDQKNILMEAFYLNKINLPPPDHDMTAYEVSVRNQQFIRQTLPLFEPMEQDYNGDLCERTFEILLRGNAFGPIDNIPQSLRGQNIQFRFESPLHDAIEQEKVAKFSESVNLTKIAAEIDPSAVANLDVITAFRDALSGSGAPANWMRQEEDVKELLEQQRIAAEQQAMMQLQAQQAAVDEQRATADSKMIEVENA